MNFIFISTMILIILLSVLPSINGREVPVSFVEMELSERTMMTEMMQFKSRINSLDATSCGGKSDCIKAIYLWTRAYKDGKEYEPLVPEINKTIEYNHLNPNSMTYVLVHGFLGYGLEDWLLLLKDKFLKREDCNVIIVDWFAGSSYINYNSAVTNVPLVGSGLASLFVKLDQFKGLNFGKLHLIGHSLGAHVSGFTAKNLPGKISRITGLEPAGPDYRKVKSSQRLDKGDAEYVDIIHTNGCPSPTLWFLDCYGINFNIGHSDFWPNGGEHQPFCSKKLRAANLTINTITATDFKGEIGCDHEMAYLYFIESLDYGLNDTFYLARPCESWPTFKTGNCTCGTKSQYMGFNVNEKVKGTFYLNTNIVSPFAKQDPNCQPGETKAYLVNYIFGGSVSCCFLLILIVAITYQMSPCSKNNVSGFVTDDNSTASDNDPLVSDSSSQESTPQMLPKQNKSEGQDLSPESTVLESEEIIN